MALSRETLISMVKNEYPSSYSAEVEKMSHEDLMGLLDYLDSIKGKADGGAIGIEVLFKDKMANGGRVGFKSGGSGNWWDGLEGEAKGIYDSMTAYGASDKEIQAKLQTQGLWSPDGSGSGNTEQVTGIINQDIGGGGGGGLGELDLTFTEGATAKAPATFQGDYDIYGNKINELGRTGILGAWDKTKDFFSNLSTPKVRGTLGDRLSNQPRLPLPAVMATWSLSPFNTESRNYNPNFVDQLNFLETQDGMIGRDQGSGLLKYGPDSVLAGKNVISLFGSNNYQEALDKEVERLEGILEKNKNKWDATKIATWKAKFLEPAYLEQQKANQEFADKVEAERQAALQKKIADEAMKGKTLSQIGKENFTGEGQAFQAGNIGKSTVTGGKVQKSSSVPGGYYGSPRKDGGLIGFNRGGLATMFTRRR